MKIEFVKEIGRIVAFEYTTRMLDDLDNFVEATEKDAAEGVEFDEDKIVCPLGMGFLDGNEFVFVETCDSDEAAYTWIENATEEEVERAFGEDKRRAAFWVTPEDVGGMDGCEQWFIPTGK